MHLSIGQGLRLIIQAAYFVLIARSLGPKAYGAFAAIVALAAVIGPFSGMGTTNLFIRDVRSGKREAVTCWGNGLLITLLSGSLLTVVVLIVNYLFHLKTSSFIVLAVCISDLIFMKITELAAFGFAASNRMKDTSIQSVVVGLLRLIAIGSLVLTFHSVSLSEWVWAYLASGILGTIYAVYRGTALWGRPKLQLTSLREDLSEGLFFSISNSATSIYNDVDKIMLSRLSDFASTGIYSTAYRVIDVSMTPVRSLVSAAYPIFFKKGVRGIEATFPYAKSLIFKASIYGAAVSSGLWICAPILPILLGRQYILAVPALRLLAPIPLLRCIHVFLADSLSGAGFQRTRTVIQVSVGLINIVANLLILPRFSWRGAAWTSLACDALLVGVFWSVSDYLFRKHSSLVGGVIPT
jgi:O-antigen/teichoic acid export membrane protein